MKRLYTLIALLTLTVGVLTGCNQGTTPSSTESGTNAPVAPASTNK